MKTLLIDNYDSFTYNLYQLIAEINGELPIVIRNDALSFDELSTLSYDNIVISPGPGHPAKAGDFGLCARILLEANVPILGVCLGHQGISHVFGGRVTHATEPVHGRLSRIQHRNDELFADIPREFNVVRYHSLICEYPLPDCLHVTAETLDGLIMGIRHNTRPLWGVQYHPESICTEYGKQLLINFKHITERFIQNCCVEKQLYLATASRNSESLLNAEIICTESELGSDVEAAGRRELPCRQSSHYQQAYHLNTKKLVKYYSSEHVFNQLLSDKTKVVWLDSSRIMPGISRFSFMGCVDGPLSYSIQYDVNTNQITQCHGDQKKQFTMDIFDFLTQELNHFVVSSPQLPFQFCCGFVGYFGYELYVKTLPIPSKHVAKQPDAQFLFLDRVIVFDHEDKVCYLLALTAADEKNQAEQWFVDMERALDLMDDSSFSEHVVTNNEVTTDIPLQRDYDTYIKDIHRCLNAIDDGDSYEICLTNQIHYPIQIDPCVYYSALRRSNPAPYSAFLKFGELAIACSSVERYLRIDHEGYVETKPIKGTLPRGVNAEDDQRLINQLQHDEKFRSENLMIVDLLRHDLGQVCDIGSIHVPHLMQVESYETVHQLVSTIRGQLKQHLSAIDCIRASFPGGSMTGAPKIRTMELIHELETEARGIYSGSIGYLSLDGSADVNIVIRTAVITPNELSIGAGGAIIALSDPDEEYQEMILKSKSLRKIIK